MTGEKRHHPASWRQGGKALADHGEEVRTAWGKLKSTSQGMGDIFGDDLIGGLIGVAYNAYFELADECFTTGADDFDALGDRMTVAGDNHATNEKDNTELVTRIHRMGGT